MVAHAGDSRVSRGLSGARGLDETFEAGKTIGGARFQLAGSLGTYALGRLTGSSAVTEVGADLFRAQIVTEAMIGAIKLSVRRTRPDGQQFSLPSGHAAVTFASATVLQRHFGWKVGIPAYGVASYVAASRIQMKRHYLSDVAFGAALGIAAGRTVTIGRGDARFALTPLAAPGPGVAFTWIGSNQAAGGRR
jgi:membrane-associated phospholipid phosphatase